MVMLLKKMSTYFKDFCYYIFLQESFIDSLNTRKGGDCLIFASSKTAAVFKSLEGLFSGFTLSSGGENSFLGLKLVPKALNMPISREPFVVEKWLTPQNDGKTYFTVGVLEYAYPCDNWKCPKSIFFFIFWALLWRNCMVFHISIFPGPICNFKSFHITKTMHVSYWIGWTFKMTETPIFLLVFHKTYINDQKKWAKMRISVLLVSEIFKISLETRFTITNMQVEKNKRKFNFAKI